MNPDFFVVAFDAVAKGGGALLVVFGVVASVYGGARVAAVQLPRGWRWVAGPMRRFTAERQAVVHGLAQLLAGQGELRADLAYVREELTYNGGATIKDQVRRNSATLKIMRQLQRMSDPEARATWRPVGDGTFHCEYVTAAFTDLTGLVCADCDHGGWASVIAQADRQAVLDHAEECGERGHIFDMEYTVLHRRTGASRRIHHHAEPVLDHDGTVIAWIVQLVPCAP